MLENRCSPQNNDPDYPVIGKNSYFGVPYSCDTSSCWHEPSQVIYNIIFPPAKEYQARQLYQQGGRYYVKERNGRIVCIGKLNMKRQIIVDPCEDGTFMAGLYTLEMNEDLEQFTIAIPFHDIKTRNITPYLFMFRQNLDCPREYITAAFLQEMQTCQPELMQLPTRPGWQMTADSPFFASAETIIPQLLPYYSLDVRNRELVRTMRDLRGAAMQLAACLPASWKYKLLLCISAASILLPFLAASGLIPDHVFVVIPANPQNAGNLIRLVKNQEFRTTAICPLTEPRTKLQTELDSVNDGTFVIRDNTFIENKRKRTESLELLLQDLYHERPDTRRHLIVVITDKPSIIPPELPALYLDFRDAPELVDAPRLQELVGEFTSAFIKALSAMDEHENMLSRALKISSVITKTVRNADSWMMQRILITTAEILREVGLISDNEMRDIRTFFKRYLHEKCDVNLSLTNEFLSVLSSQIEEGKISVFNQEGPPYYNPNRHMVFLSKDGYINFNEGTLNYLVFMHMNSTKRRNKVLSALNDSGVLHANNGYQRNLRVEVGTNKTESFSFYSISRTCLMPDCQDKLNLTAFSDYLFAAGDTPTDFIPIVETIGGVAGRVVTEDTDEAEAIFITGQTRSGKTFLEVAQSLIRHDAGQFVYVFDQTDAFCREELLKFVPETVVNKRFLFWDIGTMGLPVDVLNLDYCNSLREKKDRLEGILMVAAALTGDVQQITLRRQLTQIIKAIEVGKVRCFRDILQYFDQNEPEQAEIRARLEAVAGDLDGLPRTVQRWSDLPKDRIIVLSVGEDGIRKSSRMFDILLASLYAYKQHHRKERMTVILDELTDLNLGRNGPIDIILRKAGKLRLSMILASQRFSAENDYLGKIIGNCAIKVFFHPMDCDLAVIAKNYKLDKSQLANLEQGFCYAVGPFFNNQRQKNCWAIIKGRTYAAHRLLSD
ncbi:MAG: hypothetical protein IKG82_12840 [Oscillospiraceae bacterium]|nr:hypothetical protein [Oscillospiraceae bacterium]